MMAQFMILLLNALLQVFPDEWVTSYLMPIGSCGRIGKLENALLTDVTHGTLRGDKSLSLLEKRPSDVRTSHICWCCVRRTTLSSERSSLPRTLLRNSS